MRWRVRKPGSRERALKRWHTWFAWYPVRVPTKGRMSEQHKVWFQNVRRKGKLDYGWDMDSCWSWYYTTPGQEYDITPKYRTLPMPPREV